MHGYWASPPRTAIRSHLRYTLTWSDGGTEDQPRPASKEGSPCRRLNSCKALQIQQWSFSTTRDHTQVIHGHSRPHAATRYESLPAIYGHSRHMRSCTATPGHSRPLTNTRSFGHLVLFTDTYCRTRSFISSYHFARPGCSGTCSDNVTTPTGSDAHAEIGGR